MIEHIFPIDMPRGMNNVELKSTWTTGHIRPWLRIRPLLGRARQAAKGSARIHFTIGRYQTPAGTFSFTVIFYTQISNKDQTNLRLFLEQTEREG